MTTSSTRLLVFPQHQGLRLDQFLAQATELSRRRARTLVGETGVIYNGHPRRTLSRVVLTGDVVDLPASPEALGVPTRPTLPEAMSCFGDTWLQVVNKPAGVLSQPAETRQEGELAMDEILLLRRALEEGAPPFQRLIHRLDRVTSGLLVFALRREALKPLSLAWRSGKVQRRYLAVVEGDPPFDERRVEAPIARSPAGGWRFEVAPQGKGARTEVRVLSRGDGKAIVSCRLVTGRTHQVRVHLSHLQLPVAGDRLYGASGSVETSRPLLHAAELELPHPQDGRPLRVQAPLPEEFLPHLDSKARKALGL